MVWAGMQPEAVKFSVGSAWTSYESKKRHRSKYALGRDVHCHWGKFQTHAFHVVSSIGPIVLDVNLHGWQNSL